MGLGHRTDRVYITSLSLALPAFFNNNNNNNNKNHWNSPYIRFLSRKIISAGDFVIYSSIRLVFCMSKRKFKIILNNI